MDQNNRPPRQYTGTKGLSLAIVIGVAIGTFAAMLYRTISFMFFLRRDVICLGIGTQVKRYLISFAIYGSMIYAASLLHISITNYWTWIVFAGITFAATGIITLLINYLLMRKETVAVLKTFFRRRKKSDS